jgi:hypothetical protein
MTDKDEGEIYLITNTATGKQYVGQTVCRHPSGRKGGARNRWMRHLRNALEEKKNCTALESAIRKYGEKSFTLEVLIKCNKNMLDYYEIKFIQTYNTVSPNGYNLEKGGTGKNKVLHEDTKSKIGEQNRFLKVSDYDKKNILKSMEELGIEELPTGIHYNHNTNNGYEGFKVGYNFISRSFIAKGRSLTEKLNQALTYLELIKSNNTEKIKEFDENIEKEVATLIKKSKKIDERALEAMKNIGIQELPLSIRYEKRASRFYVATEKSNKNFKYFTKNDPEKSLQEAIEYLNSRNGNRSEGLVNPMTA